jgi:hypothetical protein
MLGRLGMISGSPLLGLQIQKQMLEDSLNQGSSSATTPPRQLAGSVPRGIFKQPSTNIQPGGDLSDLQLEGLRGDGLVSVRTCMQAEDIIENLALNR